MSDLERLLESVGLEAAHAIEDAPDDTALEDSIKAILKRRLLPLLEAGQVMRNMKFDVWEVCKNENCPTCKEGKA